MLFPDTAHSASPHAAVQTRSTGTSQAPSGDQGVRSHGQWTHGGAKHRGGLLISHEQETVPSLTLGARNNRVRVKGRQGRRSEQVIYR